MNKSAWFFALSGSVVFKYAEASHVTVICPLAPMFNVERTSATINNFSYNQMMPDKISVGRLGRCDDQMAARSNFKVGNGLRNAGFNVPNFGYSLVNNTTPSSSIIDTLNGASIRIHLGTYHYTYSPYNDLSIASERKASTEFYLEALLRFNLSTCTMHNQAINLVPISNGVLNSQQIANEQNFYIYIGCTTDMPSRVLLAKITDSYTPNNINNNGVLKNQPSLANKSNVDVQLLDENSTPLVIGTQNIFTNIPAGSIGFSKLLKARYYLSEPKETGGYVKTQATVLLDYQ